MKPRCLIVGLDGFDPDVLVNLEAFYLGCGCTTRRARTIGPVAADDLLVVQRGPWQPGARHPEVRGRVHLYDYVVQGTSDWHQAFPQAREVVVIAPAGTPSGATPPPPAVRVLKAFHPVLPALWQAPLPVPGRSRRDVPLLHIGHHKGTFAGDRWQAGLATMALAGEARFHGRGWRAQLPAGAASAAARNAGAAVSVGGPTSILEAQRLYRRAQAALGAMHPSQRGRTISGRFWQAPLNGCPLFSEATLPGVALPGVHRVDDPRAAWLALQAMAEGSTTPTAPALTEPQALAAEAAAFWLAQLEALATDLGLAWRHPSPMRLRRLWWRSVVLRHVKLAGERLLRRVER